MNVVSTLEWAPVESDLFASAAYRDDAQQLYLRFRDGKIYRYFKCPSSVYNEFMAADSKGSYFAQAIRNRFRHELVHRGNPRPTGHQDLHSMSQQLSASVLLAKARRDSGA